ncbi:MAG: exodeoxyribonuclease VII small subunit [Deltaproteobacteria bacterium]|nr:exodeoxyribonuclease VII small subunit [Deltaproteobacteria bacterium]
MAEIERLTALLERGEVPLEQALHAFEAGMAKVRAAAAVLDQAEARLARLVEGPRGELREVPMPMPGPLPAGHDPGPRR